jgi:hypothetical protein
MKIRPLRRTLPLPGATKYFVCWSRAVPLALEYLPVRQGPAKLNVRSKSGDSVNRKPPKDLQALSPGPDLAFASLH